MGVTLVIPRRWLIDNISAPPNRLPTQTLRMAWPDLETPIRSRRLLYPDNHRPDHPTCILTPETKVGGGRGNGVVRVREVLAHGGYLEHRNQWIHGSRACLPRLGR